MYAVIEKNTWNDSVILVDSSFVDFEEARDFADSMNNFRDDCDRSGFVFNRYYTVRKID